MNAIFRATLEVRSEDYEGGGVISTIEPTITESDHWHTTYVLRLQLTTPSMTKAEVSLFIHCREAWHLSTDRRLLALESQTVPPFPVGRFVVVHTSEGIFKLDFPWGACLELSKHRAGIEVKAILVDHGCCGLSLRGLERLDGGPRQINLFIHKDRLNSLSECVWIEPFPRGARAAICLTDHADFDSVKKVELLKNLLVKNDFRFTKTVFPRSEPIQGKQEPGLDLGPYRRVIDEFFDHGTEIAFHGFGPRVDAPSTEECQHRAELMKRYEASTWVDHGTGSYLFSRQGELSDGTRITQLLSRFGLTNYWSYADIWNNPFRDLNCWRSRRKSKIFEDLALALCCARTWNAKQLSYLVHHSLKNLFGEEEVAAILRAPSQAANWVKALRSRRRLSPLRRSPFLIYGIDGSSFGLNVGGQWIFDTVLLNHLALQLRPDLIDRLADDSGILIAHCYLSAQHSYMVGNCLINQQGSTQLHPSFVENVEHLSSRQSEGAVISLSFAQLRRSLITFVSTRLVRHKHGWTVRSSGEEGYSVLAGNRSVIERSHCGLNEKKLRNGLGYVRLPPNKEVSVRFVSDLN